jgi:osomolarity two-component system phosphorelay intermediate protein YPD1
VCAQNGQISDEMPPPLSEFGDHVHQETFSQILEMDESEEDRDFSKPLVDGFFDQATETFDKIEDAL